MNSNNSPSPERISTAPTNVTLKCAVCHARFTNRSSFSKHYALHKENKAFSCNLCNERFSERSKLDSHYETHSKICTEKFVCNICNKSFTDRKKYDVHYAIHTKPQTLSCNICNKSFIDRNKLDVHYLSHQAVLNTYDCKKCSRKFLYQYHLEQHMKFHNLHINDKEKKPKGENSVCVENIEKEKTFDNENNEPVKVTQTRSGRKVRFKRFYDVDDCENGEEDELPSKRCKNSDVSSDEGTESETETKEKSCPTEVNETISNENTICDSHVSIACANLSVVSDKLPDHIYKKCTENGSISVRGLTEISHLQFPRKTAVKNRKYDYTQKKKKKIPDSDNQKNDSKLPVGSSIKEKRQRKLNSSHLNSVGHQEVKKLSAEVCKEKGKSFTTDNCPNQSRQKIKEHVQSLLDIAHEMSDASKTNISEDKQDTKQNKNKLSTNMKNAKESNCIKNVTDVKSFKKDDILSIKSIESAPSIAKTLCQKLATPGKKIQVMQVLNPNNFIIPDSLKNDSSIKPNDGVISSAVVNKNIRIVRVTPELMQIMQTRTLGLSNQKVCDADKQKINGDVKNDSAIKSNLGKKKETLNFQVKSTIGNSCARNDSSNSPFKALLSTNHHTYSKMKQSCPSNKAMLATLPGTREASDSQCLADKNIEWSSNDTDKKRIASVPKEIPSSRKALGKPNMQEILMKEKVLIKLIEKMKEKEEKKRHRYELKKHMRYIEIQIFCSESAEHSLSETRGASESTVKNASSDEVSAKILDISEDANDFSLLKSPNEKNVLIEESNIPTFKEENAAKKTISEDADDFRLLKSPNGKTNDLLEGSNIPTLNEKNAAKKIIFEATNDFSLLKSSNEKSNDLVVGSNSSTVQEENAAKKTITSEENAAKKTITSVQKEINDKKNMASRQEPRAKKNFSSRQEETSAKKNLTSRHEEKSAKKNLTSRHEEKNAKKYVHDSKNKLLSSKSKNITSPSQNNEYLNVSVTTKEKIMVSCPSNKAATKIKESQSIDRNMSEHHNLNNGEIKGAFQPSSTANNGEIKEAVQSSSTAEGSKTATSVSLDESKREFLKKKESDQKVVKRILKIDKRIKISLNISNLDIGACLEAMNELDELAITSRIWKKCLIVLKTLKKCRKFSKSEAVRKKAYDLYDKFSKFYIINALPTT